MLDLSNNNAKGHDFRRAYLLGGQRRIYLKVAESTNFKDGYYKGLAGRAAKAGFKVGGYYFAHPLEQPAKDAADYFLSALLPLAAGASLLPCLDLEHGTPSVQVGEWSVEFVKRVREKRGCGTVIYGSGWWLEACGFKTAPGPLWLAAYGRNDGREYPVDRLPKPWKTMAAHQFSSQAHVIGIEGTCDLSHVFTGSLDYRGNV